MNRHQRRAARKDYGQPHSAISAASQEALAVAAHYSQGGRTAEAERVLHQLLSADRAIALPWQAWP